MHDYTAWQAHEHRLRELTQAADSHRLAADAKGGRGRRRARLVLPRWLALGLFRPHPKAGSVPEPRSSVAQFMRAPTPSSAMDELKVEV